MGLRMKIVKIISTAALLCLTCTKLYAADTIAPTPSIYDQRPWSLMYYWGQTMDDTLAGLFGGEYNRWPEHIQSVELAKTLTPDNPIRRFFSPLVGVVQFAGNTTVRSGSNQPTIYEFDPYLLFRWSNLPWNHIVNTSFAIGEGVSYDTSVPAIESRNNDNTKRLLNYLAFEATFAAPSHPEWQFVAKIHHRSGAYGLYHAGNTGSNDIGVGIRYLFD